MKLNFIWKSLFFMYVMIWLNLRERERERERGICELQQ